jgi:hypothetical protein
MPDRSFESDADDCELRAEHDDGSLQDGKSLHTVHEGWLRCHDGVSPGPSYEHPTKLLKQTAVAAVHRPYTEAGSSELGKTSISAKNMPNSIDRAVQEPLKC